ncbi:MAG: hypothetical protein ABL885_15530, partial [Methylophilaceae bacterium]
SVFQLEGESQGRSGERRVAPNSMRSSVSQANRPAAKSAPVKAAKIAPVKTGTNDGDWEEF